MFDVTMSFAVQQLPYKYFVCYTIVTRCDGRNLAHCACLNIVRVKIDLVVTVGIGLIYFPALSSYFSMIDDFARPLANNQARLILYSFCLYLMFRLQQNCMPCFHVRPVLVGLYYNCHLDASYLQVCIDQDQNTQLNDLTSGVSEIFMNTSHSKQYLQFVYVLNIISGQ